MSGHNPPFISKMILTQDNIPDFTKKLKKAGSFTDIHFGKKNNSEQHNQDCLNHVTWFCAEVRKDPTIDHIIIAGDWHEHRASLSLLTQDYSYRAAELLGELGLPIFLLVGNHDLYHRQNRTVFSTIMFKHIPNFFLVPEPVVVPMAAGDVLLTPFLFPEEYPGLVKYRECVAWWGHFEFNGFILSGYNSRMEHGASHTDFAGPKRIFSGHFHKRQIEDQVVYIGNAFPMDFSDAGDYERGMAVYEYETDHLTFIDWPDCPKYVKAKLSAILAEKIKIPENARVTCVVDTVITYEEHLTIKDQLASEYNLREVVLKETDELKEVLADTEVDIEEPEDGSATSLDELVVQMLRKIDTDKIDVDLLIQEYRNIQAE